MPALLRAPAPHECPEMTALCLRSKAHWGYDAAFMDACVAELTITPEQIATRQSAVLEDQSVLVAMAQVGFVGEDADLWHFFIDPDAMGKGYGRRLFDWALNTARRGGVKRLLIESDPNAAPFYQRMGAVRIGEVPSASIPGRVLPQLCYDLHEDGLTEAETG